MKVSVVVPLYDEELNVAPLVAELLPVLDGLGCGYELILVDDGSRDGTGAAIEAARGRHPTVIRHVALARNTGQTAAIDAGFRHARGELVVMMDGDLQVDPADIPTMLEAAGDYDLVHGWRWKRHDTAFKRLQTRVANRVRNALTGENVHDTGCPLKVFRRPVIESLKLRTGMHRFFVTLAKMEGFRTLEMKVNHRPRQAGSSKYGMWNRALRGLRDLFAIRWMQSRHYRLDCREIATGEGLANRQEKPVRADGAAEAP
ncbi:MAG: glycosyltransferase family 2 protein [Planctomycetes bacterium]|nr:glycosyltransferase family 2 protein [Planctomycetota bacterium]